MLVKAGAGIVDLNGSLGDTTFYRGPYGLCARARVIPTDTPSTPKLIRTVSMTNANGYWRTEASQADRDGWELYARATPTVNAFGQPIVLSGRHRYLEYWIVRRVCQLLRPPEPPTVLQLPPIDTTFAFTVNVARQLYIYFDDTAAWTSDDKTGLAIFASAPQNPGTHYIQGPWTEAGKIIGNPGLPPTSPHLLGTYPYALTVGQVVSVRARFSYSDHRTSASMRYVSIVVP